MLLIRMYIFQLLLITLTVITLMDTLCQNYYGKLQINRTGKPILRIIYRSSLTMCIKECLSMASCKAFTYKQKYRPCYLHSSTDSSGFASSSLENVFGTRTTLLQLVNPGPCVQHDCPESTKCIVAKKGNAVCIRMLCEEPTVPSHVHLKVKSLDIGSEIEYSCGQGPSIQTGTAVCRGSGNWLELSKIKCCIPQLMYFRYKDLCLKIPTLRYTYENANQTCSDHGGKVLGIPSHDQIPLFKSLMDIYGNVWIDGIQVGAGQWTFQDGSPFPGAQEMLEAFPDNNTNVDLYDANATCLVFDNGILRKESCSAEHLMFCDIPKIEVPLA